MTYLEMSDKEIISLLEGHTSTEILTEMSQDMIPGDIRTINDIFMEIMEMAQPTSN